MLLERSKIYNYFDVDEISMNEEVIPAYFLVPSFTLAGEVHVTHRHEEDEDDAAMLLPSSSRVRHETDQGHSGMTVFSSTSSVASVMKDVKRGQTAMLPLWAAIPLHREGYIQCFTPPTFDMSTFLEFKADPLAPSLYLKSPYFFESGIRICRLLGSPTSSSSSMSASGNDLVAQIVRLYQLRYLKIIHSARKKGFDLTDVREKLAVSERYLLDVVLTGKTQEQEWNASLL